MPLPWAQQNERVNLVQAYVLYASRLFGRLERLKLQGLRSHLLHLLSAATLPVAVEYAGCGANNTYELTNIQFTPTYWDQHPPNCNDSRKGPVQRVFRTSSALSVSRPLLTSTPLNMTVPDYVGTIDACDIEYETERKTAMCGREGSE